VWSKRMTNQPQQFRLWATSDCHVGTDIQHGYESLAEAIRHSEFGGAEGGPSFEWDVGLHLGDFSGTQLSPDDAEGRELVRQFGESSAGADINPRRQPRRHPPRRADPVVDSEVG